MIREEIRFDDLSGEIYNNENKAVDEFYGVDPRDIPVIVENIVYRLNLDD